MKHKNFVPAILNVLWVCFVIIIISAVTTSCKKQEPIDLEPFKELARNANCADITNRLFLIDDKLVFWDRRGNCPDNSYAQILFRETPEQELCSRKDSIAGPQQSCNDSNYQDLFETILDNLDENDLGLSPGHQVQSISF